MSDMTRRGFLKGAAAAGAASVSATAGCLSRQTDCSEEDLLGSAGDLYSAQDLGRELGGVIQHIEDVQTREIDRAHDELQSLYDGDAFDTDSVEMGLYDGTLNPEEEGRRSEDYDVMCRVHTAEDAMYDDIGAVIEEDPEAAELGIATAFNALVSATVHIPVLAEEEADPEHVEFYERFQDETAGIRAQIVDNSGGYMDVYIPETKVDGYTENLERLNDPRGIYMEMRHDISDNMEYNTCENPLL